MSGGVARGPDDLEGVALQQLRAAFYLYAVSNRVAWAVQGGPSASIIVRTVDGGRTWHRVLSRANTGAEAFVPQGPDGAQALARVFSANGVHFVAYRTRDAGQSWRRAALRT